MEINKDTFVHCREEYEGVFLCVSYDQFTRVWDLVEIHYCEDSTGRTLDTVIATLLDIDEWGSGFILRCQEAGTADSAEGIRETIRAKITQEGGISANSVIEIIEQWRG